MPELIHLLTPPLDGFRTVTVVCRATMPERGTWDVRAVTCAACLIPSPTRVHAGSASMTEKAWLQQVRTLARAHHWMTYHPLRSQGSEAGWIDLVLLKPPLLVCVELKTDVGRVMPPQQQWLDALAQVTTVQSHLWRPQDWETITHLLWGP